MGQSAQRWCGNQTFVGPFVSKWRGQIDGFTRFEGILLQKNKKLRPLNKIR
jgi:hypothetical protein